jgi:hypothetical protein
VKVELGGRCRLGGEGCASLAVGSDLLAVAVRRRLLLAILRNMRGAWRELSMTHVQSPGGAASAVADLGPRLDRLRVSWMAVNTVSSKGDTCKPELECTWWAVVL